jgi:hypothetical protein
MILILRNLKKKARGFYNIKNYKDGDIPPRGMRRLIEIYIKWDLSYQSTADDMY